MGFCWAVNAHPYSPCHKKNLLVHKGSIYWLVCIDRPSHIRRRRKTLRHLRRKLSRKWSLLQISRTTSISANKSTRNKPISGPWRIACIHQCSYAGAASKPFERPHGAAGTVQCSQQHTRFSRACCLDFLTFSHALSLSTLKLMSYISRQEGNDEGVKLWKHFFVFYFCFS